MKYLKRDDSAGVVSVEGEPVDGQRQPLRPWALTASGDVVYADWRQKGLDSQSTVVNSALLDRWRLLVAYDQQMSQRRRRIFETALAQDAAAHPECCRDAVNQVSLKLIEFVEKHLKETHGAKAHVGQVIRQRCYSDTGSGRLGTADDGDKLSDEAAWQQALDTLKQGASIAKTLGIHNALANVLTRHLAMDQSRDAVYKATAARVSPSDGWLYKWFKQGNSDEDKQEDGFRRGRAKVSGGAESTVLPGITRTGDMAVSDAELRKRGVDEWKRVESSPFVKGIDQRNLVFGAGRSGTTGELLKAYRTFGAVDDGEQFKQYLLAIVVYLVGGGHHSCHEIFSVANLLVGAGGPRASTSQYASVAALARDAYVRGKYVKHLPEAYLNTQHFAALREKYYDIAVLGHLHGTFV